MPVSKSRWELIPLDLSEIGEAPAFPMLDPPSKDDATQKRIDQLCEHFRSALQGAQVTGELLGLIQRAITEDVGKPVVVVVVSHGIPWTLGNGIELAGYALSFPSGTHPMVQCNACNGSGHFKMPLRSSGLEECFRCGGTGRRRS